MEVDAVIFDKDGTLIDFDAFWVNVSIKAIGDILKDLGREDIPVEEILKAYGVNDGITDIDGVLCKGTYEQMGQVAYDILKKHGCDISCQDSIKLVVDAYNRNSDAGLVRPTCPNLKKVLTELKGQGKKLAVVTTDNREITQKCLEKLGIEGLFDEIYTDDGKTPQKPDPYCAYDFCRRTGCAKERTVMIGDTMTDVIFAKNAGICAIGVAKSNKNRERLAGCADAVVSDIASLLTVLR